ncbi:MAG: hypothetical protein ACRDH5_15215, partial [bacterium]
MRYPLAELALIGLSLATTVFAQGASEMEKKRAAEIGLAPGMVLDQTTAHLAKDLLPPEIYKHYKNGEYRN